MYFWLFCDCMYCICEKFSVIRGHMNFTCDRKITNTQVEFLLWTNIRLVRQYKRYIWQIHVQYPFKKELVDTSWMIFFFCEKKRKKRDCILKAPFSNYPHALYPNICLLNYFTSSILKLIVLCMDINLAGWFDQLPTLASLGQILVPIKDIYGLIWTNSLLNFLNSFFWGIGK